MTGALLLGSVAACGGKDPCEELFDSMQSCYQAVDCASIPNVGDLEGSFCLAISLPK